MKSNPDHSKKIAQILKFQVNEKKEYRQISIPYESGRLFIQLRELIRCEAYGRCTWFYLTGNRKLLSSQNLGQYEELLAGEDTASLFSFFRIHHSHLINLDFIHKLNLREYSVELIDDSCLGIAHRRRRPFIALLKQLKML